MDLRRWASESRRSRFEDPAILRAVLADARLAWVWLTLRIALGWFWFESGRRQLQSASGFAGPGDSWASQAIAAAQTLAGIALILGAFVGLAAFAGGVLGSGFLPATAGAMPPLLFIAVVVLMLTWKTAGWIGLDRWLLPMLGMPWRSGELLGERTEHTRVSERRRQS